MTMPRLNRLSGALAPVGRIAGALLCVTITQSGCGSGTPATSPEGQLMTFTGYAKDFSGFRTWPSHALDSAVAAGSTHVTGPRTVYVNQPLLPDATEFPVGTLIVKETAADGKIFARCKRGGNFNATGAVGWEWFELQENAAGEVVMRWRGFGPPAGEMYGGDAMGGCNGCHTAGKANDYILSPWLTLRAGAGGGGGSLGASGMAGAGGATEMGGAPGAAGSPGAP